MLIFIIYKTSDQIERPKTLLNMRTYFKLGFCYTRRQIPLLCVCISCLNCNMGTRYVSHWYFKSITCTLFKDNILSPKKEENHCLLFKSKRRQKSGIKAQQVYSTSHSVTTLTQCKLHVPHLAILAWSENSISIFPLCHIPIQKIMKKWISKKV